TEDVDAPDYSKRLAENSKNNFLAPLCGLAPGFISIVSNKLMKEFDSIDTVRMILGALPLNVSNTLQYALSWST
ncbi:dehydrogenase, partial [Francisella tularensis subsp. holarctica]|nr:dehydrogenase [Francisella tularensis subsp. holarctica]